MNPNGINKHTETVDSGVPNPLTPAIADIEIDYVAHYAKIATCQTAATLVQ